MSKNKGGTRDAVKQALAGQGDRHPKTEKLRKKEIYQKALTGVVTKLANVPDKDKSEPKYDDSSEGPFGLGPLVFPCLQRFNNIQFFITLSFIVNVAHGMIFALVDLSLKIYVIQFSASKSEAFLMDFSDYFSAFMLALLIAHFGGRGNRAKWVAAGSIVTGLAAIVFAFSFFNYEIIRKGREKEELCEEGKQPEVCAIEVIPHKSICIFLFTFGQFLHGIAGMPLYMLAMTFIFDHVPTYSSGLYIAFADAGRVVGYTLGYIGGIQNFRITEKEAMKAVASGHAKRFRALQSGWWKSFIFVAVFSFCTTLPLCCFPSNLPGARKIRLAKEQEPSSFDMRLKDKIITPDLKGILQAVWCLLRNPLVLTQTFIKVSETMTFKTSAYFLPQYLQAQFLITYARATKFTAYFVIPGGLLGHFCGGYIADTLEMNVKTKLKFIMTSSVVAIVLFLFTFSVECEIARFAGISDDYEGFGKIGNLTATCNEPCGCTTSVYNSVCGRDEIQYFSPCFAGCRAAKQQRKEKTYYNCSCIKHGLTTTDSEGQYIDAVSGTCHTGCLTVPLFFAFYFSATVFSNLCSVPALLIIIQSVPTSWNSMGLGVMFTIGRFIGSVPGPLYFTATTEFACNFWDINECGEKMNCWIYERDKLFNTFRGTWIGLQGSSSLLCLYAIWRHDYVVKGKNNKRLRLEKANKAVEEKKSNL